ncbi:uncharacterized protein LOC134311400 [Trichomycterus rosablanca]|uniref:uncharacterized protein LOC134311400 n=1 Tax=Trichomycterus rosablanca TaxID=2290929 RepID=UPI002F35B59E
MFWFKKLWCCSAPSEDPHSLRPKPEKEKKKNWWQRLKKKERQEEMNVEENQMTGNEENAGMSTQVLQDQGQEPEIQVIEMEVKNQVEQSMEEKNPEEQNLVIEGIEDPLQAVILENVFKSSNDVMQQQNVQDEHVLIAPTFIIQPEECERLMETTVENQGVSVPAGAPVPPVYMLKMKRTSRWTVRPVLVLPSSKYISSALLCSAVLWCPSERPRSTGIVPPDHLENLEKME